MVWERESATYATCRGRRTASLGWSIHPLRHERLGTSFVLMVGSSSSLPLARQLCAPGPGISAAATRSIAASVWLGGDGVEEASSSSDRVSITAASCSAELNTCRQ